ncbi:MAG TPA: homoserine kinase [Pyrinomonadaceae bacterium]|nr:homoserine kinase [Pyrinomonadaceae bacterium]
MSNRSKKEEATAPIEICLPASSSNLGAGFDCFGVALNLYLTIRVTVRSRVKECRVRTTGAHENRALPKGPTNLIYRAMSFAAAREQLQLPAVELGVHNDIPLASGLGSSAAAIVGGITLAGLLCGKELPLARIQNLASEFEGHPDNVGATLHGGFVISCRKDVDEAISIKHAWPSDIKFVVVSPRSQVSTQAARAQLPRTVTRSDAVFNIQRAALFASALQNHRYDLLWEAMRDRLHQADRASLVPGIKEALAIEKRKGFLGIALSGAGPSIIALVNENEKQIGKAIAECFQRNKIQSSVRVLEADNDGCRVNAE